MTVLLASFIPVASTLNTSSWWMLCLLSATALSLDGLDGYFARRRQESSAFGARYDMEIDALLALVMCMLLWCGDRAGWWILGLGVMRYLFIAAGTQLPALTKPLFPSWRRKCVCVIQVGALSALLSPVVQGYPALIIGAVTLAALLASFARDTHWLLSRS